MTPKFGTVGRYTVIIFSSFMKVLPKDGPPLILLGAPVVGPRNGGLHLLLELTSITRGSESGRLYGSFGSQIVKIGKLL